jgi:hypothetical protein
MARKDAVLGTRTARRSSLRPIGFLRWAAVIDPIRRGTAEFIGTFALIFDG